MFYFEFAVHRKVTNFRGLLSRGLSAGEPYETVPCWDGMSWKLCFPQVRKEAWKLPEASPRAVIYCVIQKAGA